MIPLTEYQNRRTALLDRLEDDSIVVVFSGVSKKRSADEVYPFEVNHNFYYLTGLEQEDSVLILVSIEGERREYLFISPYNEVKAKWYGKRLTQEEASQATGIRNVLLNTSLASRVDSFLSGSLSDFGSIDTVYLDLEKEQKISEGMASDDYAKTLRSAYPAVEIRDVGPAILALRRVKSKAEIIEMKEASKRASQALIAALAEVKPEAKEWEIASTFRKVSEDNCDGESLPFRTIVASGINACTLSYFNPRARAKAGEMILIEGGAKSNYYVSDVCRSVPVDGKFTQEQRKLYSIVLGALSACISYVRPGLTFTDLQSFVNEYLASECVSKGFIASKADIQKYFFHSVAYHIGLDRHDPMDRTRPLELGNVLAVEVGLYFPEMSTGIRLKDVVVVSQGKAENLTGELLKEIPAIENFYQFR